MHSFRRAELEKQLDKELRFHIAEQIARYVAAGLSEQEARRRARVEFGGIEAIKEECRDSRPRRWLDHVVRDLRYAARVLRKNPGFTMVAAGALGLGLGVNTTLFTFLNAVLRPLPVTDPGRLVSIQRTVEGRKDWGGTSYPDYLEFRDHVEAFSGVAAESATSVTLGGAAGQPQEPAQAFLVSGNYFSLLGVRPILGRAITTEDDRIPGVGGKDGAIAVLTYGYWRRRFHSDPSVLGQTLLLNFHPYTIVGVMPPEFIGTRVATIDLWIPLSLDAAVWAGRDRFHRRDQNWLHMVGRLRPGINFSQAQAGVTVADKRLAGAYPATNAKATFTLEPGSSLFRLDERTTPLIVMLFAAVGLVLLIACANVANLLLSRAVVRHREIASRLALGASPARLLAQLLTESILLSALGGIAGLMFAALMSRVVLREIAMAIPAEAGTFYLNVAPDHRVFLYTLILSFLTGIVFGLMPALQAAKMDLASALKQNGTSASHLFRTRHFGVRDLLVIVQVSVCLVLLIGSGLLVRGLIRALRTDPGFQTKNMILLEFDPARLGYDHPKTVAFERRVEAVAHAEIFPLVSRREISIIRPGRAPLLADHNRVTPDFFKTLRIPIVRGRNFTETDLTDRAPVVLVSESSARRLWPGQDPLGKRLSFGTPPRASEVVGIVKDTRNVMLWKIDDLYLYLPLSGDTAYEEPFLIRTSADPRAVMAAVRTEIQGLDPRMPIFLHTLEDGIALQISIFRSAATVVGFLGLLALVLAAVGIYGVMAYSVSQRTHEIGVRMALGADRSGLLRLILAQSFRLVLVGLSVGIVGAALVSRVLSFLLFGISPLDPVTFFGVSAFLCAIAMLATYVPARRASKVDPTVALRYE